MAMGKFYCICRHAETNKTTLAMLRTACEKQGVDFVLIESDYYDLSKPMKLEAGSALYKVTTDAQSSIVYKTLLAENPHTATVFKDYKNAITTNDNVVGASLLHASAKLPIIKTIFGLPRDRKLLENYVDELGGFPIIVKATGGSHGVGVMKFDSFDGLASVVDFLVTSNKKQSFIMRQYIDYIAHARITVLGDRVVDSIEYKRVPGDFRSNVGKDLTVEVVNFPAKVQQAAVKAVDVMGALFGGVDVLIDKDGEVHIAEVNVPCYFPRSQQISGKDIAGEIVAFLMEKTRA
jgi:glutathione synthase/RimK-type ligase-like ATP-grasp enzyme